MMLDVVEVIEELAGGGAVSTAAGFVVQAETISAAATAVNFKTVEIFIIEPHSEKMLCSQCARNAGTVTARAPPYNHFNTKKFPAKTVKP
jgi:hypothetical protein